LDVSGGEDPRDANAEELNLQLNQGLKSCRSVIDNYRSMLMGGPVGVPLGENSFANDDSQDGDELSSETN
jgi:hypothetical protein